MSLNHYLSNQDSPTICDVFKAGAKDTWARIQFSRTTPRLKIHETSISQNLVYEMRLLKERHPSIDYTLYESTDEKANGDDLELCVRQLDERTVTYAIQSKIIYHRRLKAGIKLTDGYYKQLKHLVGKVPHKKRQIDLLLDYASANGFIPLYLLYNYVLKDFGLGVEKEHYGCTAINAQYLKDNYTGIDGNLKDNVKFSDLHMSPAFPWHELVCNLMTLSDLDLRTKLGLAKDYRLSTTDIANDEIQLKWVELNGLPPIIPEEEFSKMQVINDFGDYELQWDGEPVIPEFKPKYRLVTNMSNEQ